MLASAEQRRTIVARLVGRMAGIVSLAFVASVVLASAAQAQSEDQVKAAFLFNFARYVEWPSGAFATADESIRVCIVGDEAFAGVVSKVVSGKNVGERPVDVDTPSDLSDSHVCHILFVGQGARESAAEVAQSVAGAHVFTMADRDGFATGGGIANFIRANNKIRFEINPEAAKSAGLKVSSRLLRLAKVVGRVAP